jgi:hypothetical protein
MCDGSGGASVVADGAGGDVVTGDVVAGEVVTGEVVTGDAIVVVGSTSEVELEHASRSRMPIAAIAAARYLLTTTPSLESNNLHVRLNHIRLRCAGHYTR